MANDVPIALPTAALKQKYRWNSPQKTCFLQKVASGVGDNMDVSQWRHLVIVLVAEDPGGGVAGTVKVQGSMLASNAAALNFAGAQTLANIWDYLSSYDGIEGVTAIPGGTGYTFSAAGVKQVFVNTDHIRSLNLELTWTKGKFTAYVFGTNSQ